jgi:hypothetical protein
VGQATVRPGIQPGSSSPAALLGRKRMLEMAPCFHSWAPTHKHCAFECLVSSKSATLCRAAFPDTCQPTIKGAGAGATPEYPHQ